MPSSRFVFQIVSVLLLLSSFALAHHSFSNFDMEQTLTLSGVVTRWEWTNPHTYLYVVIDDEKAANDERAGNKEWAVEFHAIGQLLRLGFKKDSFKPGDKVRVTVHPSRDGSKLGFFSTITMADGTTIKFR